MINPYMFEPKFKKSLSPRFAGGKIYVPFIGKPMARQFRRASEAEAYAKRAHARWIRLWEYMGMLYDQALAEMEQALAQEAVTS